MPSITGMRRAVRGTALGALAVGALAVPIHAAAAAGSWSVVASPALPSPNNMENYTFNGVTCLRSNDCWAVGFAPIFPLGLQPLIEHYDGTSWTIKAGTSATPIPSNGVLSAVTCTSVSDCWAVGQQNSLAGTTQTLTMHYDGTAWAVAPSANTSTSVANSLVAVTCTAPTNCWAVGTVASGTGGAQQTLAERYNGATWSVVSTTNPGPSTAWQLTGVACWDADDCIAVGIADTSTALAERWTGSTWTTITAPSGGADWLQGVTCPAAADCWAAGYTATSTFQALVARFDGTSWTTAPVNAGGPTDNNYLYGIACADSTDCWAVGKTIAGSTQKTLAIQYDGASWIADTSANVSNATNVLVGVSCPSNTDCWAVGSIVPSATVTTSQTLIEHYSVLPVSTPEMPWPSLAVAGGLAALIGIELRRSGRRRSRSGAVARSTSDGSSSASSAMRPRSGG